MAGIHNHDARVATAGNFSGVSQGSLAFQQHATFLLVGRQYQIVIARFFYSIRYYFNILGNAQSNIRP